MLQEREQFNRQMFNEKRVYQQNAIAHNAQGKYESNRNVYFGL